MRLFDEPLDLASIAFGGPPQSWWARGGTGGRGLTGPLDFFARGQVFGEQRDTGRADPGRGKSENANHADEVTYARPDDIPGPHIPCGFGGDVIELDMTAADRFDGIGAGFVDAGGPEPDVESHVQAG